MKNKLKDCTFCTNVVPMGGQCNKCGFIDGYVGPPNDDDFKRARLINEKHDYDQFKNIDMLLLDR